MYPVKNFSQNNNHTGGGVVTVQEPPMRLVRRKSRRQVDHSNGEIDSDSRELLSLHFPFLTGIRKESLQAISSRMVSQRFQKKEYIYLPYDATEQIYFIKHGNVEIGYLDESGKELSIDILTQGDVFGPILNKSLSSGFARAVNTTMLAILNKDDFEEFLEKFPRFSYKILKMMSMRINSLETKLQNLVFSDVRTRICKLLFSLYEKSGDKRTGQIRIPLTHQDIANLVASSRETASLHLSELKKNGVIAYERKHIRILSLTHLQQIIAAV